MKKSTKIWLSVAGACILIGVVLAVLGRVFGAKNGVYYVNGKFKVKEDFKNYTSEKLKGVQNIDIDISEMAILVKESTGDQFYFEMHYMDDGNEPEITTTQNEIKVTQKSRIGGFWFVLPFDDISNQELILYIPKNTKFNNLNLSTRNGRIVIEPELTSEQINAVSSNGRIETGELTITKKAYFKTTNGIISCNGIFAGKTEVVSSNGKITCKGSFSGDTTLDTSNGAVDISGMLKGNVKCESSNGSVDVTTNLKLDHYDITAKTSNGSVRINDNKVDDNYRSNKQSEDSIQIKTSNGSIRMNES